MYALESITSNVDPISNLVTAAVKISSNKQFWPSCLLNYDKSIAKMLQTCQVQPFVHRKVNEMFVNNKSADMSCPLSVSPVHGS